MDKELLYRFFYCATSPEEEKIIADWLEADPQNMKDMIVEREKFNSIILHTQDIEEAGASGKTAKRDSLLRRTARYAAVAAAVVIVSGVFGFLMNRNTIEKIAGQTTTINVPAGQRINVTLHDGSEVWLNSGARIEYPVIFADGSRRVRLEGEAFFEVEHDPSRPFVVETFGYDVEVLGTKFSVNADSEKEIFSTILTEGSVRVVNPADRSEAVTLTPDQMVRLDNGRLAVTDDTGHDALLWRDGLISLKDMSFAELMDKFEKSYGVEIVIERDTMPQLRSRGKIRISEGVDHAMRILQRSCDFTYVKDDDANRIYIR